ncbi:hypothetical protein BD410DRAFT_808186 [Rickenella mellea]|uniref:Uncharacterized protein n=1 Tax=Rickenella mellea TaxID=50990 RepID=A0A4Y7PMB3_9AGAM|nr:hypothetical protein BD410DRAFT_808186 [Rickenella mellea]
MNTASHMVEPRVQSAVFRNTSSTRARGGEQDKEDTMLHLRPILAHNAKRIICYGRGNACTGRGETNNMDNQLFAKASENNGYNLIVDSIIQCKRTTSVFQVQPSSMESPPDFPVDHAGYTQASSRSSRIAWRVHRYCVVIRNSRDGRQSNTVAGNGRGSPGVFQIPKWEWSLGRKVNTVGL